MDFRHFLSDARKVTLWARTESDNHGAGTELRTLRVARGQSESREEDSVERRVSVAEFGCMSEKESVEGRADRTEEAREEGERERMLRRTSAELVGVGGLSVPKSGREYEIKKWSEM